MSPESPGRRKFSQAVAYHILSDVNGDEFVPVVDGDGMPDKIGEITEALDQVFTTDFFLVSFIAITFCSSL